MTERSLQEFLNALDAEAAQVGADEEDLLNLDVSPVVPSIPLERIARSAARMGREKLARSAPRADRTVIAPAPAPVRQQKFCRQCGQPLKPGKRFCVACGAKIG